MSNIPKNIIDDFYNQNNEYRKYFIKKATDYLLVDFTVLSLILSFLFTKLTTVSKIICIILFLLAIIPKYFIISKKLREFLVPIDEFWERYAKLEENAKDMDKEKKYKYINKEAEEIYYATKKDAAMDTHKYYINYMGKLNRYISFSFFSVVIVLLNLGALSLFGEDINNPLVLIPFNLLIISIFIISLFSGFNLFSKIKEALKNIKNFLKKKSETYNNKVM